MSVVELPVMNHLYSLIKGESHRCFDISILRVQLGVRLHSLASQRLMLIRDEREAIDIAQLFEAIACNSKSECVQ
jgi:hypothetical protein